MRGTTGWALMVTTWLLSSGCSTTMVRGYAEPWVARRIVVCLSAGDDSSSKVELHRGSLVVVAEATLVRETLTTVGGPWHMGASLALLDHATKADGRLVIAGRGTVLAPDVDAADVYAAWPPADREDDHVERISSVCWEAFETGRAQVRTSDGRRLDRVVVEESAAGCVVHTRVIDPSTERVLYSTAPASARRRQR